MQTILYLFSPYGEIEQSIDSERVVNRWVFLDVIRWIYGFMETDINYHVIGTLMYR